MHIPPSQAFPCGQGDINEESDKSDVTATVPCCARESNSEVDVIPNNTHPILSKLQ